MKALFLAKLYRRDTNMTTQQKFHTFLFKFLEKAGPLIAPGQMVKAPDWWLLAHQQMGQWPEYRDLPRPGDNLASE